ncbi:MAG TPA: DUF4255 domain-containing protein [Fimbriimonas sp.]
MSNQLAFATLTFVLQRMLNRVVGRDVSGATATATRPDGSDGQLPAPGVNIYLLQANPSGEMGSLDLPTRTPGGAFAGRPTAAHELLYLLTFHGSEARLEPQRVQASVHRFLHAEPCISKKEVRDQISALLATDSNHFLKGSNLADQPPTIKITPYRMTLEELSKVWSVFFQTNYILSSLYKATYVVLDTEDAGQAAFPVRFRMPYAVPVPNRRIDRVLPERVPFSATATILLQGQGLLGPQLKYLVDGVEAAQQAGGTDEAVTIRLPAGLKAGYRQVRLLDQNPLGPGHVGTESNAAPFLLLPSVKTIAYQVDASVRKDHTIRVVPEPAVAVGQRAALLLNRTTPPGPDKPWSYTLAVRARTSDADPLVFAARDVESGTYIYRLRVDETDSPMTVDTSNPDPLQQPYNGPTVVVP